ncbi:helicase Sen1p [[Candida] anglica]|uniref:Helicase Sen1p n=1 Tax=[Candida] anglica TaxID=148631 RepID=A0ABP0EC81_9ASCO
MDGDSPPILPNVPREVNGSAIVNPAPEGFEALIRDIKLSFQEVGNSDFQNSLLVRGYQYLQRNSNRHWFCDEYMYPISRHLLILFSFPDNQELSTPVKAGIRKSITTCTKCAIKYHQGKSYLRETLTVERGVPVPALTKFIEIVDSWEAEVVSPLLSVGDSYNDSEQPLDERVILGIQLCILNPGVIRMDSKIATMVRRLFEIVHPENIPSTSRLDPGIVYFLFEGTPKQINWAIYASIHSSDIEKETTSNFVDEFKTYYYRIQDAKHFSTKACIKFWQCFLIVEPNIDTKTLIDQLNSPKDLEVMSVHQKIRLYPLFRVLLNHIMSFLNEPLPILLRALDVLLARLKSEFWKHSAPYTFVNILDTVLMSPYIVQFICLLTPNRKDSPKLDTLSDVLSWMSSLTESLVGSQQQIAGVRLGQFLLQQEVPQLGPPKSGTVIDKRKSANAILVYNLGCQLLQKCIRLNEDDIKIGDKNFLIELLKKRDARAAIDNRASQIVDISMGEYDYLQKEVDEFELDGTRIIAKDSATKLISMAAYYDISNFSHHTRLLQDSSVPTSLDAFPLLWSELVKGKIHTRKNLYLELFQSFKFVSSVVSIESNIKQPVTNKALASALSIHNRNVQTVMRAISSFLEKLSLVNPTDLKLVFTDEAASVGYWSCVLSPHTNQAAIDIMYQVFDDGGARFEAIQALLKEVPATLNPISQNITILTQLKAFEPCPKSVRILMDIVEALADPLKGLLNLTNQFSDSQELIKTFWKKSWQFLVMIYQGALTWANQYPLERMIEFTRDTLDLSRKLLDSFMFILEATKTPTDQNVGKVLFQNFMNAFHYVIVWLRLGDVSLLNSCVDLVFKGFDLAKDMECSIDRDFLMNFTKYGAKAKKFNNKLSENQRFEILSKAREFDDALVESVVIEVQEQRSKSKQNTPIVIDDVSPQPSKGSLATYKYQTHIKQPRQQTLGRFGVVTKDAPVAPAPPQLPASSLDAIRQSLKSTRSPVPSKPLSTVAPAPARPAGFNSKRNTTPQVGRSLNSLKKKKNDSDSSEDEEEQEVDLSDLFVEKKKKAKVIEVDISGRPLVKPNISKQLSDKRREEEYMRLRLNVNLKPLYSTILKWNFNSNSEYPTKEIDIYKPTKEVYTDAKDYVKVTEPLLMLECWQGIQSAKQTGQDVAFELLIGSRTSCDGFFDVYASVRKDILQDRRIGESDLLVLGCLQGESFDARSASRYLKDSETITCLAKVREIKSANADFSDITVRVFPQGSMMGILTPKSVVIGVKVMQMVTVEREYSSLKGIQYYDLAENIFKAQPQEPINISDQEADKMLKLFGVNKSQAKAVLGSYNREGFSLIQGPPGTGKTKTILGIVGYYLSMKQKEGVITFEEDSSREGTPPKDSLNAPKVLVCAPSNAAVDELCLRLRNGVKNLQGEEITPRVVRLGRSDAINASVRDLTLEELVDKQLAASDTKTSIDPTIREEHTKCITERNRLKEALQNPELKSSDVTKLEDSLREVNKKRNELAKKLDDQRERVSIAYRNREIERRQIQAKILGNAQIICSTLSGSAHDFIASLSIKFDQVIIDEACQCVELSAIIPLRYGCKKCIMVGDPNQLPPTVLSKAASNLNYEESLFVRMQRRNPNSVYLLDVQYRMHPEISVFPSAEFYNSRLLDGPGMEEKNTRPWHDIYPLSPYRFFDVAGKHQQNAQSRSLFNYAEAQIVLEMVEILMQKLPQNSFSGRIGVISPYKEQIRTMKDIFKRKYGMAILNEIDFNTVDGYQGQEKEIIIMSCVRASPTGNVGFLSDVRRMNVALTRARTTLWILGNKESLMRNKVWNRLLTDATHRNAVTNAYPGSISSSMREMRPEDKTLHFDNNSGSKIQELEGPNEYSHPVKYLPERPQPTNPSTNANTATPPSTTEHPEPVKQKTNEKREISKPISSYKPLDNRIPPREKVDTNSPTSTTNAQSTSKSLNAPANNVNQQAAPYNRRPPPNPNHPSHPDHPNHDPNYKRRWHPSDLRNPNHPKHDPNYNQKQRKLNGGSQQNGPSSSGVLPPRKRPAQSSMFINNKRNRPFPK